MHLQDVLKFIGMISEGSRLHLELDCSAAIGVMNRIGVGHVRHLETKAFWTQELVQAGKLKVIKTKGDDNTSDLGTNILDAPRIRKLANMCGYLDSSVNNPEHINDVVSDDACGHVNAIRTSTVQPRWRAALSRALSLRL